jgi:hypothetical protein
MGLALVMVEEHARGAVHLGHDHALGPVHDERAVRRHQGHVAHEDILFLDVLDGLRAGILVDIEHDQTEGDLERRGIGQVALLAFLDVEFRGFELVLHELQHGGFVEILDRKDRLEDAHDAFAVGRLGRITGIQEEIVGGFLHLDEVRHVQDFADFAEKFADTFLACVGLSHVVAHLSSLSRGPLAAGASAESSQEQRRDGSIRLPSHRQIPIP